jgi:hypothetical protein
LIVERTENTRRSKRTLGASGAGRRRLYAWSVNPSRKLPRFESWIRHVPGNRPRPGRTRSGPILLSPAESKRVRPSTAVHGNIAGTLIMLGVVGSCMVPILVACRLTAVRMIGSGCSRVSGDPGHVYPTTLQHVQPGQPDRLHREEVTGESSRGLGTQERRPSRPAAPRRWPEPMPAQNSPHRRRRHPDTELAALPPGSPTPRGSA